MIITPLKTLTLQEFLQQFHGDRTLPLLPEIHLELSPEQIFNWLRR